MTKGKLKMADATNAYVHARLLRLAKRGAVGIGQREIAKECGLSLGGVCMAIRSLEASGLVRRERLDYRKTLYHVRALVPVAPAHSSAS